jgi:phospholipid/cholesterol/gamma-HCH transport system ATP-binding protein
MNKILVILPDTNSEQANLFCEKLSRNLDIAVVFQAASSKSGLCYSVSAGIAQAQKDSQLQSLLADAEARQNIFYECSV